ncbi:MAG: chemotaxis protein CheA [Clostridia bacterium]|nr:chemotaxis protein CheA [Clostridia bacterium]
MGNDMMEAYLYEMNTLLEQLDELVLSAEKAGGFSQEDVNEIFRIMHTIKGSSAMMEFNSLMTVAHRIEDLFFVIRDKTMDVIPVEARSELFDLIFQAIDFFRGEAAKLEKNEPLLDNVDNFLININSFSNKINSGDAGETKQKPADTPAPQPSAEAPAETVEKPSARCGQFPFELQVFFDEDSGMENLRALMLINAVKDFCEEDRFVSRPENVESDPSTAAEIVENGFFLCFKTESDRACALPAVTGTGSVRSYQLHDVVADAPDETEEDKQEPSAEVSKPAGDTAEAAQPAAQPAAPAAAKQSHSMESPISVNLSKLDQLMAVVGEIVITESMVTASPDLKGLKLDNFFQATRQLRALTDELQDVSMSLRMVPVSSIFQKMKRIVRDMGKKLNKEVSLVLIGEETEVDKTIVDSIGDPIMHIVRNSMDHGIEETVQDRYAAGKKAVGEIVLSARHTGSEVIIEITDDGRGADDDKILAKAIKQGLAQPDVDYSHKDILNFLIMPGFSTNTEVTEFSGRGVGMDVVKSNVENVGGTVTITSEKGKGMTTTLKIPLTMAIMDGMEVAAGKSIFTIPINNIRQIFKVTSKDIIHDAARGEMIKVMDNFYSIIRVKDLYDLGEGLDSIEDGILLWVEAGENAYCLFVDELIGEQKVVVKPLPGYVNDYGIKNYGISGCTILGDGNISMIMDIANIYSAARAY